MKAQLSTDERNELRQEVRRAAQDLNRSTSRCYASRVEHADRVGDAAVRVLDAAFAQCYRISESDKNNGAEQAANARLMAAAPDLLKALKRIAALYSPGEIGHQASDIARAAIAKADSC